MASIYSYVRKDGDSVAGHRSPVTLLERRNTPLSGSRRVKLQYLYLLFPFLIMISLLVVAHVFTIVIDSSAFSSGKPQYSLLSLFRDVGFVLHKHFVAASLWRENDPGNTLRNASSELQVVVQAHEIVVLLLVSVFYLFLQTFSIPGTILLNAFVGTLLAPSLFPSLFLCVVLGTCGAFCSFSLSKGIGTALVSWLDHQFLKGRGVQRLTSEVRKHRDAGDLFGYFLFLRLTPVLPNWLINLASPIAEVPVWMFTLGTAIGITPQTFLAVRFGMFFGSYGKGHMDEMGGSKEKSMISLFDTCCMAFMGIAVLGFQFLLKHRFSEGYTCNSCQ